MTRKSTVLTMFINFLNFLFRFPPLGNKKIASECSDLHINPAAAGKEERGCFGKTEIGVHCVWEPQDCSQISMDKMSEPKKTFLMTVILYIFMTFIQFIYLLVV